MSLARPCTGPAQCCCLKLPRHAKLRPLPQREGLAERRVGRSRAPRGLTPLTRADSAAARTEFAKECYGVCSGHDGMFLRFVAPPGPGAPGRLGIHQRRAGPVRGRRPVQALADRRRCRSGDRHLPQYAAAGCRGLRRADHRRKGTPTTSSSPPSAGWPRRRRSSRSRFPRPSWARRSTKRSSTCGGWSISPRCTACASA